MEWLRGFVFERDFRLVSVGTQNRSIRLCHVWEYYVTTLVVCLCSGVDVDLAQIASGLVMKVSIDLV